MSANEDLPYAPVPLPVPNPTRSFWLHPSEEVNPLAKEGSDGPIRSDTDICIIGSGITGVSAAYHLSKIFPEKKVVILEARDFCSGATGRNGGHLINMLFQELARRAADVGIEEAKKLYALEKHTVSSLLQIIMDNDLGDAIDLVQGGFMNLLTNEEGVKMAREDIELAKNSGMDVSEINWITKDEMHKKFGVAFPAISFPGNNLWPLKLVTQLFYLAQKKFAASGGSLSLHTSAPATAVAPAPQTPGSVIKSRWMISTPRGSLVCSAVLHATNAYASHLLPSFAGPCGIIPVRGQVIATRANVPFSVEERGSWALDWGSRYWFPRPPKAEGDVERPVVILGGARTASVDGEVNIADDSSVNAHVGKALRESLPSIFPGKYEEGREPDIEWTGIMGFTSARAPFVGPVLSTEGSELAGQYIAAGYSGHGMPQAFSCSEAVASLLSHDLAGLPRDKWCSPTWLPNRFLTWNRV